MCREEGNIVGCDGEMEISEDVLLRFDPEKVVGLTRLWASAKVA